MAMKQSAFARVATDTSRRTHKEAGMKARRGIILAGVVMLGLWSAGSLAAQEWSPERLSRVQNSIVRLITLAPDGSEILRGNGFLISADGLLLTNFHLIEQAARLQVYVAGGDVYDHVIVKALDSEADLALLKIPAFNATFTELASAGPPSAGNSIFVAPQGKADPGRPLRSGKVIANHRLPSGTTVVSVNLQWDALTRGAPVFNLAGECVGITTLGYEADVGPGIFIDAAHVAHLFSQKIESPLEAISWDLFEPPKDEAIRESLRAVGLRRRFPNPAIRTEKDLVRRLEWALEFDPTDLTTKELLARAYLQARRFDAASKQVGEILTRDPSSIPALTMKGDLSYYKGDFDAARAIYQDIVARGFQPPHHYDADLKGVRLPDFYHDHAIAGCSGPLILSAEKLTYLPIGFSHDQWTAPYATLRRVQLKAFQHAGRPVFEFNLRFSNSISNEGKTWAKNEFQLRTSEKETKDALLIYLQKRGVEVAVNEK
jgi:hypothetical protein